MSEQFSEKNEGRIDKELLDACIHCGLCLPACPTYLATGREMESPRGRIYLMNLWASGNEDLSPRLLQHIDSCLGCLGCQTACPSGVNYEAILNQFRPQLARKRPWLQRVVERFIFLRILPDYKLLIFWGKILRFWQKLNGRALIRQSARWLPLPLVKKLALWESYLPYIPAFEPLPRQSWNPGKKEGTVQLFAACVMDIFYGPTNHAAIRLLLSQKQVVFVPEQTCCGALAYHAGDVDIATQLARRNIAMFAHAQGPIVVTSAGCGAMLKHYGKLLQDDEEFKQAAERFAASVEDISEFLARHEFPENVRSKARAPFSSLAYHSACHLAHAQGVRLAPEKLIKQAVHDIASRHEGSLLSVISLADAELCCGSAGTFNLAHPELSDKILAAKMERLKETGAEVVVTSNPGCLLQLEAGIKRQSIPMKVRHLAEFLDETYGLNRQPE